MRVRLSVLIATVLAIVIAAFLYSSDRVGGRPAHAAPGTKYVVLQMNLCLSGQAACFQDAHYPLDIGEARTRIIDSHADAVTLNEVCLDDVEELARDTGYHMRFATVTYRREPLSCIGPGDRGLYGIAVLTKAGIRRSVEAAYAVQDEIEQRHWICATTDDEVTVCATHLDIRISSTEAVNDAQCAEFAKVLEGLQPKAALIAAGDMNRREPCAPAGMWTRGDDDATQAAGVQQAYGDAQFSEPATTVIPMTYTDHDALVVTSQLTR
jgi:endonuclease/exonuclease/phosphatase family metal-dependent hydrolase